MFKTSDARIVPEIKQKALVDEGEMTNKVFAMDNRSFYKPKLD